jgi:hypothetical protein
MNWSYNSNEQAWHTSLNGWQAHVTVSPRWHVYLAAVKPQQGPQRIAPKGFHTFQEAQQWCNQQVQGATSV